ncbi:restriction endonuclease [Bradyrhizobium elkanii]
MARSAGESSIQKGNAFRDLVASMLESAGFVAETETREKFKKVDVRWRREDLDGPLKYFVEAKDYEGTLGLTECREFVADYGGLIESADADRAWLISKGPISPDGRALVDAKRGCKAMTFAEFQRRLLGLDSYLHDLIASFDAEQIADWYVPLHAEDGADLEKVVRNWIDEADALPLAIVAGFRLLRLHRCQRKFVDRPRPTSGTIMTIPHCARS